MWKLLQMVVSIISPTFFHIFLGILYAQVGYDKQGLPIGMQLIGRPWCEASILRLAAAIEVWVPFQQNESRTIFLKQMTPYRPQCHLVRRSMFGTVIVDMLLFRKIVLGQRRSRCSFMIFWKGTSCEVYVLNLHIDDGSHALVISVLTKLLKWFICCNCIDPTI